MVSVLHLLRLTSLAGVSMTNSQIVRPVESAALVSDGVKAVGLDPALVALICAALLYSVSWVMGCSTAPSTRGSGGKKFTASSSSASQLPQLSPEDADDKWTPAVSGRKITIEK